MLYLGVLEDRYVGNTDQGKARSGWTICGARVQRLTSVNAITTALHNTTVNIRRMSQSRVTTKRVLASFYFTGLILILIP